MDPEKSQSMVETTDALEAVSVCQSMKNFLFVLIVLSMFICQLVFWMNWFGLIDKSPCSGCDSTQVCPDCSAREKCPGDLQSSAAAIPGPVYLAATVEDDSAKKPQAAGDEPAATKSVKESVKEVIQSEKVPSEAKEEDMNPAEAPTQAAASEKQEPPVSAGKQAAESEDELSVLHISCQFAKTLVGMCNFVILIGTALYCLTLLICLKISLAGRLGGLSHITRSFFLSLILLVVVIPWQEVLPGVLVGSVWTPQELLCGSWAQIEDSLLWKVIYCIRFCGFWLIAFWLLIWAQGRSAKWARATLRRLGVVK